MNNITNINDEVFTKYAIIKPPEDFTGDNQKYTRLVVDSRVRNTKSFPNQNNYDILFDDDITDVISAQLIYVDIPFTNYLINQYFNTLNITYIGNIYIIVIDIGDYDNNSFIAEMQSKLNTVIGNNMINITYNTKLDSYIFTSLNTFTFNFIGNKNNLAMLLGFSQDNNYISESSSGGQGGQYILNSPYRKNFNYNNYIIMDIDQFDLLKSIDRDLNKSYAMIPKTYDVLNIADHPQYIKIFSPPIPRLTKLHIQFSDRFGNKYDFQNMDHRFEILLTSFKQKRKYSNIFT